MVESGGRGSSRLQSVSEPAHGHDVARAVEELPEVERDKVYVFGFPRDGREGVVVMAVPARPGVELGPEALGERIRRHLFSQMGVVVDDVVLVSRRGTDVLIGQGHELAGHHMEIRGVGLIDIPALFGIRAVRQQKRIEVVV